MKILFLTLHFDMPSTRFRILQYIKAYENLGITPHVKEIPKSFYNRLVLLKDLNNYDIIFLQKKLLPMWFVRRLRKHAKNLIFDFDDAILYRDSNSKKFRSLRRLLKFKNILKNSDAVVAGNTYLKELATPYNNNIHVIPTGIDTKAYIPTSRQPNDQIVIGWIGSKSNLIYLSMLREPINKLFSDGYNIKLHIVCDAFIEGFICPVEKIPWSKNDEIKHIQNFDIGVLPMIEDICTKGKCALKLLQYMSCGLASVSTSTEVTRDIIIDGENGYLAFSFNEWSEKLKLLIKSSTRSKNMGKKARNSIQGRFDIKTLSSNYVGIFRELTERG